MALICPVIAPQYFDPNGMPLAGGKLFFYEGGSFSTEKTTYSNRSGTVENSNPIVLDSSGYINTNVFLDVGYYNITLTRADGTTVLSTWTNVSGIDCDCSKLYFGAHTAPVTQSVSYADCAIDSSGNIYNIGTLVTTGAITFYGVITKTDNAGAILWQRYVSVNHVYGAQLFRCVVDSNNNLYVFGLRSDGGGALPPANYDIVVFKYSSSGTLVWQRVLSTGIPGEVEFAQFPPALCTDTDNNVYIAFGQFYGNPTIAKYNSSGVLQYQVKITTVSNFWINHLSYDSSNDTICYSGEFRSLGRINASDGSIVLGRAISLAAVAGSQMLNAVAQDNNTYVIMTTPGPEVSTLTVFKLDDTDNIVWQRYYDNIASGLITNNMWSAVIAGSSLYIVAGYNPGYAGIWLLEIDTISGICTQNWTLDTYQTASNAVGISVRDDVIAIAGAIADTALVARLPINYNYIGVYGLNTYTSGTVTETTPAYTVAAENHGVIPGTLIDSAGNLNEYTFRVTGNLNDLILA